MLTPRDIQEMYQEAHADSTHDSPLPTPDPSHIVTNEKGGKQSKIDGRMTEVPPLALKEVSKVMGLGSVRYPREADGTPNWHRIDSTSNLDHALLHATHYLAERNLPTKVQDLDRLREELSHFAARALMALEMYLIERQEESHVKDQ